MAASARSGDAEAACAMYCFLNQHKVRLAPLLHAAQTPPGPGAQVPPRVISLRPSLPAPGQLRRAGGYACPRLTPARTICSTPPPAPGNHRGEVPRPRLRGPKPGVRPGAAVNQ